MLFQFLVRQKSNVILLQETFLTEEIQTKIDKEWGGKTFHSFGTKHSRGAVILIKKNVSFHTRLIHLSNDGRVIVVEIEAGERKKIVD